MSELPHNRHRRELAPSSIEPDPAPEEDERTATPTFDWLEPRGDRQDPWTHVPGYRRRRA